MAKQYPAAIRGFGKAVAAEKPWAIQLAIAYELGQPKERHEHTGNDGAPIQTQEVVDTRPSIESFLAQFNEQAEQTRH